MKTFGLLVLVVVMAKAAPPERCFYPYYPMSFQQPSRFMTRDVEAFQLGNNEPQEALDTINTGLEELKEDLETMGNSEMANILEEYLQLQQGNEDMIRQRNLPFWGEKAAEECEDSESSEESSSSSEEDCEEESSSEEDCEEESSSEEEEEVECVVEETEEESSEEDCEDSEESEESSEESSEEESEESSEEYSEEYSSEESSEEE